MRAVAGRARTGARFRAGASSLVRAAAAASPYAGDATVKDRVGGDQGDMHELRCGEDKSVEGIAVIPVRQASAQANLGREGCWRATLLQEKRTQAPDKGNHLGPFFRA